ncbi:Sll0314/Alr1548 family TPR repeat-containing protein [Spirulina sp. 06S082]|uniref:Sll0314/Alr1548 family TPR repeat-containing protein n=1 Tax=Spirulina sp. 06S082 TaxID=3110248 RepID=UPI002B207634|nr:Sll0314/Alr1548 family TPR repeat-containing protein [Spirulina sp. 06S082]MEA5469291.1 Sll0314/Alr1548 family TPR repeat-containing protein [Spirulina sp. 06S082]
MMKRLLTSSRSFSLILSSTIAIALSGWGSVALAGDPFQRIPEKPIGDATEEAFEAMFKDGDYRQAERLINTALREDGDEPLAHALRAGLAYNQGEWEVMLDRGTKTKEAAERLMARDPVRGNLYKGVGLMLEGAYDVLQNKNYLGAVPKLQAIFQAFDAAKAADANDPELNLAKGYMELLLAINLPFSSPDTAIENFRRTAKPDYLVDRGLALAYRDLKQFQKALDHVNRARSQTADNPEIIYLKAQILHELGKVDGNHQPDLVREAIQLFDDALDEIDQFPNPEANKVQLEREKRIANEWLEEKGY